MVIRGAFANTSSSSMKSDRKNRILPAARTNTGTDPRANTGADTGADTRADAGANTGTDTGTDAGADADSGTFISCTGI